MNAYMTVFNVEISSPAVYVVVSGKKTTSWCCVLPRGWEFSHPGSVRISTLPDGVVVTYRQEFDWGYVGITVQVGPIKTLILLTG